MEYFYAQIGDDGVCFSVTQTAGSIDDPKMIPLDTFKTDILGCTWLDGQWIKPNPDPTPTNEVTQ